MVSDSCFPLELVRLVMFTSQVVVQKYNRALGKSAFTLCNHSQYTMRFQQSLVFLASQAKYWRSVCERWECLFRWDDAGEKVCMSLSDSYCLHALSYIFQKVQLKFSSCSCALYNNHNLWSTTRQHRHNPRVKFLTSQCSLQFFITAEISQAFVLVRFFSFLSFMEEL